MSLRPILVYGDPRLEAPNDPVEDFGDRLQTLVAELFESARRAPGLGLAALILGTQALLLWISQTRHQAAVQERLAPAMKFPQKLGKLNLAVFAAAIGVFAYLVLGDARQLLHCHGVRKPVRHGANVVEPIHERRGQPEIERGDGLPARGVRPGAKPTGLVNIGSAVT